ncbi:hypothetical protein N7513_003575 [Penicillium frequentans]|nr:hypothetical protein N7513_003575 [Penicillium glabrum]
MAYSAICRPLQLTNRILQWCSAVIVMGLTSYFISKGPTGQHIIYQEVIAVLSRRLLSPYIRLPLPPNSFEQNSPRHRRYLFYLYAHQSSIVSNQNALKLTTIVYSWLTAFIFAAQDYNWHLCYFHAPAGISCGREYANEAFMFLAFFFTFCGVFLEVAALWAYRIKNRSAAPVHKKYGAAATCAPLDAPAGSTAQAGTV